MFDKDLLESLDAGTRRVVEDAIIILVDSGVVTAQRMRFFTQIASLAETGEVDKAAEQLVAYRLKIGNYLSLQELGETFKKERGNEHDANDE